jgi:hypothetical protein
MDASVALSDAGDSPETFSNTLLILCYYSLAISDLMVVDNTFSIVSDNQCRFACQVSGEISSDNAICSTAISVWACQPMPWFNQGL